MSREKSDNFYQPLDGSDIRTKSTKVKVRVSESENACTLTCTYKTRCVCETQMHPIVVYSKAGKGHKDKYMDLVTRNAHVQYESSSTHCSKANYIYIYNSKVKVFKKWVKLQGQGHKVNK